MAGHLICPVCTLINSPHASRCEVCGVALEDDSAAGFAQEEPSRGEWECSWCTAINPSSARACAVCERVGAKREKRKTPRAAKRPKPSKPTAADAVLCATDQGRRPLTRNLLEHLFDDDGGWFVHPIAQDGHCFFRAFSRAYNTVPRNPNPPIAVGDLRQVLAAHVTPNNLDRLLATYQTYDDGVRARSVQELQDHLLSASHYAVREDIAVIQHHYPLVYPLMVNKFFRWKTKIPNSDWMPPYQVDQLRGMAVQCVQGFPRRPEEALYMVLLHRQELGFEHFELLANERHRLSPGAAHPLVPEALRGRCFRAVFAWHELPLLLRTEVLRVCNSDAFHS